MAGPSDLTRADIRRATPVPAARRGNPIRDLMHHVFGRAYRPSAGAAEFVLLTGGIQKNDEFYGYGVRSGAPLGYGQRPMIALHTRVAAYEPTVPVEGGAIRLAPLANNPNEV